jgi:hypothetical protein
MPESNQPSELEVVNGPICRHLRTKAMYVRGDVSAFEINESNSSCWCSHTQNVLGPDDKLVEGPACVDGRGCFEVRV